MRRLEPSHLQVVAETVDLRGERGRRLHDDLRVHDGLRAGVRRHAAEHEVVVAHRLAELEVRLEEIVEDLHEPPLEDARRVPKDLPELVIGDGLGERGRVDELD